MSVAEIYEERAAFSFEVFPPKTDVGMEKLCGEGGVLEKLYTLNPDYISCTYGAGGTNVGKNLEVLDKIKKDGKCTPVTHFTCIGNTKADIKEKLQTYLDHGIDHMLALRGDLPFGWTGTNGDLHYATELVKFVRKEFGDKFTIAVAGSPEGHIQCRSLEADIAFLKQKQDNGEAFTEDDYAALSLTPLMSGKMSRKDMFKEAIRLAKPNIELSAEKATAMLYTLADKFLDRAELDEIKEVIRMTRLGQMLMDEGMEKGIELNQTDSIKKLMKNMNLTIDQAMNALEVPTDKREKYRKTITPDN